MTRVNLVDVSVLSDQHLIAERLELTWVFKSAIKSLHSKNGLSTYPEFVLGTGHVSFFHDKLQYIKNRFYEITDEMINRGMSPKMPYPDDSEVPKYMMNDYIPTDKALKVIKLRIYERLNMKIPWYKYRGKGITQTWVDEVYK
jgi:deoxyribonuclease (pyrimidine dimer)